MTLQQFLDQFKDKYQLRVTMISCGVSMIYSDFMTKEKLKDRLPRQLTDVVEVVTKQTLPAKKNHLTFEVCVNRLEDDEDAEGVDVPFVRYVFRK
jgi:ubiquitin-activating enzyme E1